MLKGHASWPKEGITLVVSLIVKKVCVKDLKTRTCVSFLMITDPYSLPLFTSLLVNAFL